MRTLEDFEIIEEEEIRHRAETERDSSLKSLLDVADEWREAGCTPRFILFQKNPTIIACVAEESFGQYYH